MMKGKTKKNEEDGDERCPLCQLPLYLLAKGSQHRHVTACVNTCCTGLPGLKFSRAKVCVVQLSILTLIVTLILHTYT